MSDAQRDAARRTAVAVVSGVLTGDVPAAGVLTSYLAEALPQIGTANSGDELGWVLRYIQALPESFAALVLPIAQLAGEAIRDLAKDRESTVETVLASIADNAFGPSE